MELVKARMEMHRDPQLQVKPWDRLAGESAKAFDGFTKYRDLPADRTYQQVADLLHCNGSNVRRWAARWNWHSRARDWDIEMDQQHQAAQMAAGIAQFVVVIWTRITGGMRVCCSMIYDAPPYATWFARAFQKKWLCKSAGIRPGRCSTAIHIISPSDIRDAARKLEANRAREAEQKAALEKSKASQFGQTLGRVALKRGQVGDSDLALPSPILLPN
jgi:hypothetical protein